MSSKKPSSEPLEPEGTGVPADDAAEHTISGSSSTDDAVTTTGSPDAAESAPAKSADPDATTKVGKSGSDAAAKADDSTGTDETAKIDKSTGADETVKIDKPAADPDSEKTVKTAHPGAAAQSATGTRSGLRSVFPLPALIGAAVLVIAALVAVGVFFYLAQDRQTELDRRAAATKAACDFGNSFATYTGDKAEDYLKRLDQGATGEWKKLVSQIGPDLQARFAETQVNSTANEVQCGYESGEGDKARVVLVIDQQFTTAGAPQQAPGQVKVAANVDMEQVDGRWLVADFDTPMMQQ